jgi:hypothetical protein
MTPHSIKAVDATPNSNPIDGRRILAGACGIASDGSRGARTDDETHRPLDWRAPEHGDVVPVLAPMTRFQCLGGAAYDVPGVAALNCMVLIEMWGQSISPPAPKPPPTGKNASKTR